MTQKVERSYSIKDADLLLTASTVVENAILEKELLQKERTVWQDPFFDDIRKRIDHAVQTNLGYDSAKHLRKATLNINSIQAEAVTNLAICKVQIQEDFKKTPERRNEILAELGFNLYTDIKKNGNQQELVGLLYQFKTNLTEDLKKELVEKGISATRIEAIITHADFLHGANVLQEANKSARKIQTVTSVAELNDLYDDIISICKIAKKFYTNQAHKRELFSFAKISKSISGKPASPARAKKKVVEKA
jgi:hypothetical protein